MIIHEPKLCEWAEFQPEVIFCFCHPVHCVKIFNIRPYRYLGPVTQGEALGYLLPLQERFPGITSHLELQMCNGTDPSPFIWPCCDISYDLSSTLTRLLTFFLHTTWNPSFFVSHIRPLCSCRDLESMMPPYVRSDPVVPWEWTLLFPERI